uniref:Uncharacterized protein n=1 Tax=Alexandrium andersonii TaxID=327968 RepID=A0A7S2F8I9_9DINO
MVAMFPNEAPEVHVASLEAQHGRLKLQEAQVQGRGEVSMGRSRTIDFADVASMDTEGGMLALLSHDGSILVQLHMENAEDQQTWANAIRAQLAPAGARAAAAGGANGEEDDVCMLQARSQQLQNRIGILEGIGHRRDLSLQKMQKRVDGAMRMLAAVKEMCSQQRRVLEAQKVAIAELCQELGEPVPSSPVVAPDAEAGKRAADGAGQRPAEAEPEAEAEAVAEEEIAAKTKQMLELLQQADEMQKALHDLQGLSAAAEAAQSAQASGAAAMASAASQTRGAPASAAAASAGNASDGSEDGDPELVHQRLQQLLSEKQKYEGMVRDSQQEHEDLLNKLNDMRHLMNALGIPEVDGDEDEDEDAS